jgi:hypothetical protein
VLADPGESAPNAAPAGVTAEPARAVSATPEPDDVPPVVEPTKKTREPQTARTRPEKPRDRDVAKSTAAIPATAPPIQDDLRALIARAESLLSKLPEGVTRDRVIQIKIDLRRDLTVPDVERVRESMKKRRAELAEIEKSVP